MWGQLWEKRREAVSEEGRELAKDMHGGTEERGREEGKNLEAVGTGKRGKPGKTREPIFYNPDAGEAEAGGWRVVGKPGLHKKILF